MQPAGTMDGERVGGPRRSVESVPSDHQEVEWQFDVPSLAAIARLLAAQPFAPRLEFGEVRSDHLHDTYVDTPDWRFHRAGYALRVRRAHGTAHATLKAFGAAEEGVRRRREITEPIDSRSLDALAALPGPVGERVRAVAAQSELRALFEVRTRRRRYALDLTGADAAELALDRSTITAGADGPSTMLSRVEIEVPESAVADWTPVVDSIRTAWGLVPATTSKFEAGLAVADLLPAEPVIVGPHEIDGAMSIGAAAFAVLREHVAKLLASEPGTRLGDDVEALHDMRVATRRLRVAMNLFAEVLPVRARRLRAELGRLGRVLGTARDLDVHIDELTRWALRAEPRDAEALEPLLGLLRRQRARAQEKLLRFLDGRRYERLVAALTRMLEREPARRPPAARQPALAAAPDLVRRRYRKMRKCRKAITPESPPTYHELRIAAKRLRYAVEFVGALYGKPASALVKQIVALQDDLGLHQDADVATTQLRALCETRGRRLPSATFFVIGEITQWYAERAQEVRARFPKLWAGVRGKRWNRLRRAMDDRRPPLPATEGSPFA